MSVSTLLIAIAIAGCPTPIKSGARNGPVFFFGAPGRAYPLVGEASTEPFDKLKALSQSKGSAEVKSSRHPTGGSVSWTARVPIMRRDLKEAAVPQGGMARRTQRQLQKREEGRGKMEAKENMLGLAGFPGGRTHFRLAKES